MVWPSCPRYCGAWRTNWSSWGKPSSSSNGRARCASSDGPRLGRAVRRRRSVSGGNCADRIVSKLIWPARYAATTESRIISGYTAANMTFSGSCTAHRAVPPTHDPGHPPGFVFVQAAATDTQRRPASSPSRWRLDPHAGHRLHFDQGGDHWKCVEWPCLVTLRGERCRGETRIRIVAEGVGDQIERSVWGAITAAGLARLHLVRGSPQPHSGARNSSIRLQLGCG